MLPMMILGVTALGIFTIPMGFQFLSVVSGKALLLAKMALMLAMMNGAKRVIYLNDFIYLGAGVAGIVKSNLQIYASRCNLAQALTYNYKFYIEDVCKVNEYFNELTSFGFILHIQHFPQLPQTKLIKKSQFDRFMGLI